MLVFSFPDTEENQMYRNFLTKWDLRFPSDEEEEGDEEEKTRKQTKIFDYKTKKFVTHNTVT